MVSNYKLGVDLKGISLWIWLIGGVIIGFIIFTVFMQLMAMINLSRQREFAKESFSELTSTAFTTCESREGTKSKRVISFSDLVKVVYSTKDKRIVQENVTRSSGKSICMLLGKEIACDDIKCDVEMSPLIPEKSLTNIINQITGQTKYTEFSVEITKTKCGVSILKQGEQTNCVPCDYICNGLCANSCQAEGDYPFNDPDCQRMENSSFWCEGDKICDRNRGEHCGNSRECSPERNNQPQNSFCNCKEECAVDMKCDKNHCCPKGTRWDGTKCVSAGDLLIVALKANLKSAYSDSQIQQLEDKIKDYINALESDEIGGTLLYLDEDATSDIIGNKVTNPGDWNNVDGILQQVITKTNSKYLLIVGGYARFPSGRAGGFNSDNPYADITGDNVPDIAIGRIPEPNGGDIDLLLKAFDTFTNLHKSGGIDLSKHVARTLGTGYLTMECFSQYIWGSWCSQYPKCGIGSGDVGTAASGKEFFYLTQHGSPGPPQMYGGPVVPSTVAGMNVNGAMWMIVPCHGGVINYGSTSQGITLTFFKQGGAVFLGSTYFNCCANRGSSCSERIDGGIGALYYLTAKNFAVGVRVGDAYKTGKAQFISSIGANEGYFNCFYGDPTLKIKTMWSG